MFLRRLEHDRIMFGMFSTCFEPRNSCRSHPLPIFVDFQQQYVKIGFFKLKKCCWTHVIQNPLCRFFCVCRTDMRRRAFESPDLALYFAYLHHGCWKLRKFFTAPQRSGIHFFLTRSIGDFKLHEFNSTFLAWKSQFSHTVVENLRKWLREPSTAVPGLEISWKHSKHYSFMFQTP